jgi:hypothetical protein
MPEAQNLIPSRGWKGRDGRKEGRRKRREKKEEKRRDCYKH